MSRDRAIQQLRERIEREARSRPPPPPLTPRKHARIEAYRTFTRIFSQAVSSLAVADPKGVNAVFEPDMAAADLGREARAALAASRFIPPDHPEYHSLIRFPTEEETGALEARNRAVAGVKTRAALYKGAGYVALRMTEGVIEVVALRYRGRGHWEGIRGSTPQQLPETVTDDEFGAAILAAIDRSRRASR